MKKTICLGFVFLMLLSVAAFATQTRVLTMGENNTILRDGANIGLFPSTVVHYPNMAVGGFGSSSSSSKYSEFKAFGIRWGLSEENSSVLATHLYNADTYLPEPFDNIQFNFTPFPLPNKRIDLYYGQMFNDLGLGCHLGLVHSSQTNDNPDDVATGKDAASFAIYNFGFGLTLPDGNTDIAAGVSFVSFSDKGTNDKTEWDQTKSKGNMSFNLRGRHFHEISDRYTFVPHANFEYGKAEAEFYALNGTTAELQSTEKWTEITFDAGSGLVLEPIEKVKAVADFGIKYYQGKEENTPKSGTATESKESDLTLPYFKAGFEGSVFKWMAVRFGATSYWNNHKEEEGDATYKKNYPTNMTYLGFGFHWNRLHVDAYTNPQLFLDGFNFISGATNNMNAKISLCYKFNL